MRHDQLGAKMAANFGRLHDLCFSVTLPPRGARKVPRGAGLMNIALFVEQLKILLLPTRFCAEIWTSADVMTLIFGFHLILRGKLN